MNGALDVVVVGAGHNGLIAAALLAKRGARVTLLERRDVVGGAAVTETPFGPRYKVTTLSYRNGVLQVRARDAAWQREVQRAAGIVRHRLDAILGAGVVKSIDVVC